MASQPPPPRAYRAACPNCGAPVEFRSAASAFAVCSYCHATLARDGATLRRIGVAAELFTDFSPLQLGASGRFTNAPFTVVGRVQYAYDGGVWNEWQVFFDAGRHAWLSEDNGRYVIAFAAALSPDWPGAPSPATLRVGAPVSVGSQAWTVASMVRARIGALEGEMAEAPPAGDLLVVELRSPADEVASLEYSAGAPPRTFVGRSVDLVGLQMRGLRQVAARPVAAQSAPCPQCGAALTPTLSSTKAIVCGQCHAVVDLSHGLGGDLAYYSQHNGDQGGFHSQLELGTTATLALGGPADTWQAVGYVERRTVPAPGDEVEFWREYLLYHRTRGFAFLVDANDGWSWSAPITGAPVVGNGAVQWHGTSYRELYRYDGRVTYVLGEFYWNLAEGETTGNVDYADASGRLRLNRETTDEIVWSAGETLSASTVAAAFGLPDAAPLARDATALHLHGSNLRTLLIGAVLVILVLAILAQCSSDRCRDVRAAYGAQSNEYRACARSSGSGAAFRSAGGAFGGFSGSGGHK